MIQRYTYRVKRHEPELVRSDNQGIQAEPDVEYIKLSDVLALLAPVADNGVDPYTVVNEHLARLRAALGEK